MNPIDINKIQKILPHRYPFLMIDRVVEVDPGNTLTAIKNITVNQNIGLKRPPLKRDMTIHQN